MAIRIKTYNPQIGTQDIPNVPNVPTVRPVEGAFGGGNAQALQSVGKSIGDVSEVLQKHMDEQRKLQEDAAVSDFDLKHTVSTQDQLNNPEVETVKINGQDVTRPKGILNRKGLNTIGSTEEFDKSQNQNNEQILAKIQDPTTRQKVRKNMMQTYTSARNQIISHEAKETREGYVNSIKANRDLAISDVSLINDKAGLDRAINKVANAEFQIKNANGDDDSTWQVNTRESVKKLVSNVVDRGLLMDPTGDSSRRVLTEASEKMAEDDKIVMSQYIDKKVKEHSTVLMDDLNSKFIDGTITLENIQAANIPKEKGGIGSAAAMKLMKDLTKEQANKLDSYREDSKIAENYIKSAESVLFGQDSYKAKQILVDAFADGTMNRNEAQKINRIKYLLDKQKYSREDHPILNNIPIIKSWFSANDSDSRELANTLSNYLTAVDSGKKPNEAREEVLRTQYNKTYPEVPLGEEDKLNDPTRERQLSIVPALTRIGKGMSLGVAGSVEGLGGAFNWLGQDWLGKRFVDHAQEMRRFYAIPDPKFSDQVAAGFGSMATFFIPGLGISKGVQIATAMPRLAAWLGVSASTVLEATVEAGSTYQRAIEKGMPAKDSANAASKDFWVNIPTIAITNKLGLFGDKGKFLVKVIKSSGAEGFQEFSQTVIGNIAVNDPAFEGSLESAAVGFIVGGGTKTAVEGTQSIKDLKDGKELLDKIKDKLPPVGMSIEDVSGSNFGANPEEGKPLEIKTPEQAKDIVEVPFKEVDGVKLADVQSKSNIAKGIEIIKGSKDLQSSNLFESDKINFNEAKKLAEDFYYDNLYGTSVISPALNSKVIFDEDGLSHVIEGKRKGQDDLSQDGIKRRAKLLPKVKDVIENAQVVENMRDGEDGKTFSLLGKFTDGSVLRVIVQQIEKGGRRFFSVFDVEDLSKKIARTSSPSSSQSLGSSGVGEAPSALKSDVSIQQAQVDVKNPNITNEKGSAVLPLPKLPEISFPNVAVDSKVQRDFKQFIDSSLVPLSTRLGRIDESLRDALRKFEFNKGLSTYEDLQKAMPFMEHLADMPEAESSALDLALKNANKQTIQEIVDRNGIQQEYNQVRGLLDDLYNQARESGLDVSYLDDYFPRRVNDPEEFLNYLRNSENWSAIEKAIKQEEQRINKRLNNEERAEFINKLLRGYGNSQVRISKPSNIKTRKIEIIDEQMNAFYKNSATTLQEYIVAMNSAIEAKKFFGFNQKTAEDSIGAYVRDLVDTGIISHTQENEVRNIVAARFQERGTHGIWSFYKNLGYLYTMASPISAITQIGDLAFSFYENGLYSTIAGLKNSLSGKKLTKQDVGVDVISDEFSDKSKSGAAVTKVFKMIGLEGMDNIGKETLINGSMNKLSKLAVANDPELTKEVERVFGEEATQTLEDLKNHEPSVNVKYLLFSRLAKYQPIALSEMPEYYANGGNLRIFYMLKSYTIKQLDVFNNEIFSQMSKDPAKAVNNLIKLSLALASLNAGADVIKDVLLGRPIKLSDIAVDNILRLFGFSKYTVYKAKREGFGEATLKTILPPIPFVDDLYKDLSAKDKKPGDYKIWNALPIVGKFYYWWFGGGREYLETTGKKKRKTRSDF